MQVLTRAQVNSLLRERQGDKSLRKFAEEIDLSAAYLSDVYRGNREPGPKLLRLVKVKRIKKTTIEYRKH